MPFITKPLSNLRSWTRHFSTEPIPVLGRTVLAIDALRQDQDRLAPRDISSEVRRDPLMTLKTLAWAGRAMGKRTKAGLSGEIETVEAAIIMMGVTSFFREFETLEAVETRLKAFPAAHLQIIRLIGRSINASNYAADWAAYRQDLDVAVIHEAALLHDLAEMLTWCFAPELSIRMQQMRQTSPTMRSVEIQKDVLGVSLDDLSIEIFREWRLPSLLLRLTNYHEASHPAVKNVMLAANLARHAANGWTDPALQDDFQNIAELLNQTPKWVESRVKSENSDQHMD